MKRTNQYARKLKAMSSILAALIFAVIFMGVVDARKFVLGLSRQSGTIPAFCRIPYVKQTSFDAMTYSHNSGGIDTVDALAPSISSLVNRARRVREILYGDKSSTFVLDPSQLSYPSSTYDMTTDNAVRSGKSNFVVKRGFCNWLIPDTIMIGQYPGVTPESNGPTSNECRLHIQNMVQGAKISLFCCLQSEVPSQEDCVGWKEGKQGNEVYLEPESLRKEFPRPFARYGPLAQSLAESQLTFLHRPIEDVGVPTSNESLLLLLSSLIQHLEINNHGTIYLHCWGGRGRAGLVGCCLASLFFPKLSASEILDWIQAGYDTRSGAESMHDGLKRSPQTDAQRRFVRDFVRAVHYSTETTM